MKIQSLLAAAFTATLSMMTVDSFACGSSQGWANPDDSTAVISIADVAAKAEADGVKVAESKTQYRCGSDTNFDVTDGASGEALGTIPVPSAAVASKDGRFLAVRLQQLLQTQRTQLIAVNQSKRAFYEDVDGLREDFGIGAYVPNALPIEERTSNNGQNYTVYITIEEYCSERGLMSPYNISQSFATKTLEYIPGRVDYSANSIYRKGDLKKQIFADAGLVAKLKTVTETNEKYCRPNRMSDLNWSILRARLDLPAKDLLKTAAERLARVKATPTDAYMLNENRIAIIYPSKELRFAGSVDEMIEVQNLLSGRGVLVDKTTRLDWKGKITVRISKERNRPLPASLQ